MACNSRNGDKISVWSALGQIWKKANGFPKAYVVFEVIDNSGVNYYI